MDIVTRGIILGVYVFVIIILYIFISSPFNEIVTSLEDIDLAASDAHIEQSTSGIRLVFDMIFVIIIFGPITWFIVDCLKRDPYRGIV